MRIIAGERRGHKFDGPKAGVTRPTTELVRESLFNILREAVDGRIVVDLFAGTGAIGLEGLSRGASQAIFVEKNRENVGLIHRNLELLRYEDRARVQLGDAYRWARTYEPVEGEPVVVVLDPPYRDYETRAKKIHMLVSELMAKLPSGSMIAVESGLTLNEGLLPEFEAWDVRRYGGTQVGFLTVGEGVGGIEAEAADAAGPSDADS